jgi:hypothetical protein
VRRQPKTSDGNEAELRALRQHATKTFAAPCEEKYIDIASPMRSKVYFNLSRKVAREAATHYRTAQFHHPALEPASQDAAVKV